MVADSLFYQILITLYSILIMFLSEKKLLISALVISLFIFLSACGSDHDHGPTPAGLEILVDNEVVAIQEGTEISYPAGSGAIELNEGDALDITVQFFTDDGERYNYTTEDGYSLRYNITDQNVIEAEHPINNNEWSLRVHGQSQGSSAINFELWHVDHSDFDSRDFQFSVN